MKLISFIFLILNCIFFFSTKKNRDSNFVNILERAISNGAMVIVTNLDGEIDPIFYSLIYLSMTSLDSSNTRINKGMVNFFH